MRWKGRRESANVEDRRSLSTGGMAVGGGVGTLLLVLALAWMTGQNPGAILNEMQGPPPGECPGRCWRSRPSTTRRNSSSPSCWPIRKTSGTNNSAAWAASTRNPRWCSVPRPRGSACGLASSAVGPFYCPGDHKLYIDLAFFDELKRRFGAPGDFAQAYVIAHEVGHHVQTLLGTTAKVDGMRRRLSKVESNQLSVRMELQADFLAGVWAHHAQKTQQILDPGDLEEALRAAQAIGDDALQRQAQGYVVPDSFTHGSSEQRIRWFRRGFETGDMSQGDTFSVP